MSKLAAVAAYEPPNVKLTLSANEGGVLSTRSRDGYRRAEATLTRRQAVALAYRLLHAANEGLDDADVVSEHDQTRVA